jgi:microcystin-dependent protein
MDWMESALGEITIFAGSSRNLPKGWIFCNGQTLNEMQNKINSILDYCSKW